MPPGATTERRSLTRRSNSGAFAASCMTALTRGVALASAKATWRNVSAVVDAIVPMELKAPSDNTMTTTAPVEAARIQALTRDGRREARSFNWCPSRERSLGAGDPHDPIASRPRTAGRRRNSVRMRSADRMAVHLRPVTLRNWIVRPDAPALAVSGLSVGLLGFAHGGYFPEAWGWASIALCWCAICTVMLRESVDISIRVVWLGAGVAAALAWSAVSLFWTSDVTNGVKSVERDGLYLSILIAAITVCERRARVYILGGVTAGIVIVSTYAVLTRLFPDRLGVFADPQGPGRLFAPLGYWNGEAELSAIGLAVVACGCAYLRSDALRIVAAGTVPTLSLAVFFTYSQRTHSGPRRRGCPSTHPRAPPSLCSCVVDCAGGCPGSTDRGSCVTEGSLRRTLRHSVCGRRAQVCVGTSGDRRPVGSCWVGCIKA